MRDQVAHAVRVAPLVVVPRHELDELRVKRDARLGVEHRRRVRPHKVRRHHLVLRVRDDPFERALGRSILHRLLDLLVRRRAREAHDEVDGGDVERRHAEGHARELAREARDDLADRLGGPRRGGDDVRADGAPLAPILHRGPVDGALRGGRGVHGGHEAHDDAELVVDNLGEGGDAVGRAGCVGELVERNAEIRRIG